MDLLSQKSSIYGLVYECFFLCSRRLGRRRSWPMRCRLANTNGVFLLLYSAAGTTCSCFASVTFWRTSLFAPMCHCQHPIMIHDREPVSYLMLPHNLRRFCSSSRILPSARQTPPWNT